MIDRVVNVVGIFTEPAVYLFQRPRGMVAWIHTLGDLAGPPRHLGVALQIMKEPVVRSTEDTLARGAKAGLRRGPGFFRDFATCQ